MKICITSDGDNLNANVDLRFGRCPCFILYDTNTDSFEAIPNTNVSGMGGVGVQNATMVIEKGAEVVITGNLGPNASRVFQQAGVKTITDINGKIKNVIANFKKGLL